MNAMTTKIAKMLALMPVVALAAACNGVAPTTPSDTLADGAMGADGNATTMTTSPKPCAGVVGIGFQIVHDRQYLWIEASYKYVTQVAAPTACAAPAWTSNRKDLQVALTNPFRAGFLRSADGIAIVTATAPNGVRNSIQVDLSSDRALVPNECAGVTGVSLRIVPSTVTDSNVHIEAAYLTLGPAETDCAPPTWSADRRGLRVALTNPFRAQIARAQDRDTTVTATAPNGVSSKIIF